MGRYMIRLGSVCIESSRELRLGEYATVKHGMADKMMASIPYSTDGAIVWLMGSRE